MSTIAIGEAPKKYLQSLRRKYPNEDIPSHRQVVDDCLMFVKENENDFLKWMKKDNKSED